MQTKKKKFRVLRLLLSTCETSGPYNLLCLPLVGKHDITISTYFKPSLKVPREIRVFDGGGSIIGYLRNLKEALSEEFEILHAHTPHVAFLFLVVCSFLIKSFKFRTVFTLHTSYDNLKFRNRLLLFPIFFSFKRIVACSRSSFESLPWYLKKPASKKIRIIPNGTDIARIDQIIKKNSLSKNNGKFKIIYVGHLINLKKPITLLHSFKKAYDGASELIFIGDGNLKKSIIDESKDLGLENSVKVTGEIPRDKVYEYMASSDLFISPSSCEGLPIAVLEAMACYCLLILSDIPSHREIVGSQNFIPLIHTNDVDRLAKEIKRFRQMTLERRKEIGKKCRELVEKNFSLANMINEYERIYYELLNSKNKS